MRAQESFPFARGMPEQRGSRKESILSSIVHLQSLHTNREENRQHNSTNRKITKLQDLVRKINLHVKSLNLPIKRYKRSDQIKKKKKETKPNLRLSDTYLSGKDFHRLSQKKENILIKKKNGN